MEHEKIHAENKVDSLRGRYINLSMLESFLESWSSKNQLQILGHSVEGRPIYKCQIGSGKTKILMWSQMHGNESTTTKGLIDFMNLLQSDAVVANEVLRNYTFCIIPMLNPDGAEVYTRVNANEVDLNRDFQNLSQPESQLLMRCYLGFNPDYCYNLHDQRTIFGVGTINKPATLSFLAPSIDEARQYDEARVASVHVIMKMVRSLETYIPGQIGRFDDGFNINCAGDTFQSLQTPTVLIEAGHFPEDYDREETRKYVFIALLSAFTFKSENVIVENILLDYLNIPQNMPNYFDIVYKNVNFNYDKSDFITNFAVQFREELIGGKIVFNGFIAKVKNLEHFNGHFEYDAKGQLYTDDNDNIPKLDEKASFCLNNKPIFVNGLVKK